VSLRRRLLGWLLPAASVLWVATLVGSFLHARYEINELFDTQQVQLARQILSALPAPASVAPDMGDHDAVPPEREGEAELEDMSIAVWGRSGQLVMVDQEGVRLPRSRGYDGFDNLHIVGEAWRVYYQHGDVSGWTVAVGQRMGERREVILDMVLSQLSLWLIALPILVVVMFAAIRHATRPLQSLASEVERRSAEDLRPLDEGVPSDLRALVTAMNRLFARVGRAIENERRLTADAAHELRTPIAALQAQIEVAQIAKSDGARSTAMNNLTVGVKRLSGLVNQLLTLERMENLRALPNAVVVRWDRVMERVLSDCLPQADAQGSEVGCVWPKQGEVFPLTGDEDLLAVMLRNLVDNAVRYAGPGAQIEVVFGRDGLRVQDNGPGVARDELTHLGERFHRPPGNAQAGSGLGLSIVKRIADLHGLQVGFGNFDSERGFCVTVALRRA